jgi:hypothetical protein
MQWKTTILTVLIMILGPISQTQGVNINVNKGTVQSQGHSKYSVCINNGLKLNKCPYRNYFILFFTNKMK